MVDCKKVKRRKKRARNNPNDLVVANAFAKLARKAGFNVRISEVGGIGYAQVVSEEKSSAKA